MTTIDSIDLLEKLKARDLVVAESFEPSLEEREQFFTDAEPQPVLPVARSNEELLRQVIDTITERAKEETRETIRALFVSYHMQVNDLIAHAVTTSDKLVGQLRLEVLEEIECGIITALNKHRASVKGAGK